MPTASSIPQRDRIPFAQKIAFSLGSSTDYIATILMTTVLWMPFFNIGLKMSPVMLGVVLMILRGWDAISDPIMGNISDNARTRWGRRRPFMFVGAILAGVMYPVFWHPPAGWSQTALLIYLTVVGIVFFSCFTTWSMPYYGLQLELTPNYDERTRLNSWMALVSKLTGLVGGWMLYIITWAAPETAVTEGEQIVGGMQNCSWFIAALIIAMGILPAIFVKERYYKVEAKTQRKDPFWSSIRESVTCGPLWILIAISFFVVLGATSVSGLGQYVNIYLINRGDLSDAGFIEGWKGTAMLVSGILSIPVWTWLSEKLDKKRVVGAIISLGTVGHLLNYVCLNPEYPYLQLIPAVFASAALNAIWIFLPSMKADVADYDEIHTSKRREGALNAFYSWFIKASLTLSFGVGGWVLDLAGFDANFKEQTPEVLDRMVAYYLFIPVAIYGLAFACLLIYPLNRNRMSDIRDQLEARRGVV